MNDCPKCEYNKNRAALWRAEAYKQAGHDVIELPWVGLTDEEANEYNYLGPDMYWVAQEIAAFLKEKNT